MSTDSIDYSVYLVTGRDLLPAGKDYLESLEQSLQGGVTIVQIREKHAETAEFLQIAKDSKVICDRYNVPLLINDRIDIALAVGAHGVHVGQTDMPIAVARELLPKGSIIGTSCNTIEDVKKALRDGVDYVGIGAVWGTKTKEISKPLVGVRGVGALLEVLDGTKVKVVAIGGIKSTNLLRTLYGSVSVTDHSLDGVAIVSDIVGSSDPRLAAEKLSTIMHAFKKGFANPRSLQYDKLGSLSPHKIIEGVVKLMNEVRSLNPLIHQITNTVVATQSANITLGLGASPIMATGPEEMEDLAGVFNAVLVNIGTLRSDAKEGMLKAGLFANTWKKPVVFDPVGIGATQFRKDTTKDILNTWQASVIKGNSGELAALAESTEVKAKGVDSVGPGFKDPASFVRALAKKERCVVVMTGPVDYISDGQYVVSLKNGDEILGKITGSGCITGSSIATYCAVAAALASEDEDVDGRLVRGDMLLGAISGVLILTIAAEITVQRGDVKGPGTFLPALIDELWSLKPQTVEKMAKIEIH